MRTAEEQAQIDEQLNEMIRSKYLDINYNGLNNNIMNSSKFQKTNKYNYLFR